MGLRFIGSYDHEKGSLLESKHLIDNDVSRGITGLMNVLPSGKNEKDQCGIGI